MGMIEKDLNDYFKNGLIFNTFEAYKNLFIWENIADEVDYLEKCDESIKRLYSFIQLSAMSNLVLNLGQLFDKDKKSRSIQSFLKLVEEQCKSINVIGDIGTINLLKKYNCRNDIIEAVKNKQFSDFATFFSNYYLDKINSDENIKSKIDSIKKVRDKIIAHNEVVNFNTINIEVVRPLLMFVLEIISIYGMAYKSSLYNFEDDAFISAFFVKENIDKTKF